MNHVVTVNNLRIACAGLERNLIRASTDTGDLMSFVDLNHIGPSEEHTTNQANIVEAPSSSPLRQDQLPQTHMVNLQQPSRVATGNVSVLLSQQPAGLAQPSQEPPDAHPRNLQNLDPRLRQNLHLPQQQSLNPRQQQPNLYHHQDEFLPRYLPPRINEGRDAIPLQSMATTAWPTPTSAQCVTPHNCNRAHDVYRWGVVFDGDAGKLNAFLNRIDTLRHSRGVDKSVLFLAAGELFAGHAKIWFDSIRDSIANWDDLVGKLRCDFLPPDYELRLLDEIRYRTQGPDEKLIIFISVMIGYFNRLNSPPPISNQIQKIIKNMQPYYQSHLALTDITNMEQLRTICRKLEESRAI